MLRFFRDFISQHWKLLIILVIAAGLRLYRIGDVPHGMYWDEAAISYNAWGISLWNRDEHAIRLPLSFKSFGDYKAPLLIYVLAAVYTITGLSLPALRVLIAVLGLLNVIFLYYIAKRIADEHVGLVAAGMMAVVPWAVHFSRIGTEATLALTLVLAGISLLLRYERSILGFSTGIALISTSLYAYHSAKIFVPLLFFFGGYVLWRRYALDKKRLFLMIFLAVVIALPLLYDTLWGGGFERGKTLIFYQDGTLDLSLRVISRFVSQLTPYLSPKFWLQNSDVVGLRHGVIGHGVLYYSILLCAIVGAILAKKRRNHVFVMWWLLFGMMPALLAEGNPHAIRSMMALPALILLASIGYVFISKRFPKWTSLLLAGMILFETVSYLGAYYGSYAISSALAFQFGYKEAITIAEKRGKDSDGFVVTSQYGQPYIYTLLYRELTPEQFQFGALANYSFHEIDDTSLKENFMYVATPEEIAVDDERVIHVVRIPESGEPVFVIAKT